jgi:para-nitrobenzyl esterase
MRILASCIQLFALLLVSIASVFSQSIDSDFTQVKIEGGLISGTKNVDGDIQIFKGIPFAAPPTGVRRWKAPQPVESWLGVKKCVEFGPSPMQGKPVPFSVYTSEFLIPEFPISENCLHLNVWTGAKSRDEKRPVLVWIYGGGFMSGGSACPIYDGEALAKKGVILVSINYRVGVFGFFAHPELRAETPYNGSGNYGLMDQIAALKWIQKNISAFGGDPGNVTIAGQSAGSMSVNCLVASPLARGLFHKAIAESGSSLLRKGFVRTEDGKVRERAGLKITNDMGVKSIDELRKLSAEEIQSKAQGWFTPVIDGYVLPKSIPDIFAVNAHADIPLLTGWNNDETFTQVVSTEDFKKRLEKTYGDDDAQQLLRFYPVTTEEESVISQKSLGRDESFGISNYVWAVLQSRGKKKVFLYNFFRKPPATKEFVQYGAFHTAEVPYAFNTLKFFNRPLEKTDHQLAERMSSYWANFASTGDPNEKGLPEWPAFRESDAKVMIFDMNTRAITLPRKEVYDFLFSRLK